MLGEIYAPTASLTHNEMTGLILDDTIWFQGLRTNRLYEEHVCVHWADMTSVERMFYSLMMQGIRDQTVEDKPMDASMRAMRYSAVLGDHLALMSQQEKIRVSGS